MAHRPRRLIVIGLTLVLATAGCSDKKKPAAEPSTSTGPTGTASASGTPSVTPSATASGGTAGTPTSRPSGAASTAPGTSPTSRPGGTASPSAADKTIPVTVTLAHACVSPGGSQRADVTTAPDAQIAIDTVYSDGKEGQTHGGLKSDGRSDAKGQFTYTWTVLPGTPPGTANTFVGAVVPGKTGRGSKTFEVKLAC